MPGASAWDSRVDENTDASALMRCDEVHHIALPRHVNPQANGCCDFVCSMYVLA